MPAFAFPEPLGAGHDPDDELQEARSSLAYWEDRAHRLPLHAVRGRREARDMAHRWRSRVAEAERAAYGRGLLGLLLLLAAERRLPVTTRARGRTVVRRGLQLAAVALVAVMVLMVAAVVAAVEVIVSVIDALT